MPRTAKESCTALTATNHLIGSPEYIAPEPTITPVNRTFGNSSIPLILVVCLLAAGMIFVLSRQQNDLFGQSDSGASSGPATPSSTGRRVSTRTHGPSCQTSRIRALGRRRRRQPPPDQAEGRHAGASHISVADLEFSNRGPLNSHSRMLVRSLVNTTSGHIATVEIFALVLGTASQLREHWDQNQQLVTTVLESFHVP